MNYRKDKYGNDLSVLGFGCMRFPKKKGKIDMEETERQIMSAVNNGINYFDTAYIYPGSEAALGEIFSKNGIRDKVYIATKLPNYLIRSKEMLDKFFNEQLKRLQTDHIDYYLMHMLPDTKTWNRLKGIGIEEWIAEKKASGAIRQIGFSYHGNSDMFCQLLDAYDWDMCLIQYNYMDENSQAGRRGLKYANEKGIPVMIMEPLRGGKLVNNLPDEAKQIFDNYKIKRTPAQWAFRWLWNQPEVTVVLSGMNSDEMVADNIQTASTVEIGEMGSEEEAMLQNVVKSISAKMKVGCTGCGYCMSCPKNINIVRIFEAYNRRFAEKKFNAFTDYIMCTAMSENSAPASACVGCGKCEKHCPQSIEIRKHLKDIEKEFEGPVYKVARKVLSLISKS